MTLWDPSAHLDREPMFALHGQVCYVVDLQEACLGWYLLDTMDNQRFKLKVENKQVSKQANKVRQYLPVQDVYSIFVTKSYFFYTQL